MKAIKLSIEGLVLIEPRVFEDPRGYFFESYNKKTFDEATGTDYVFVQDNQSLSTKGVMRGLHFQTPPHGQTKLVRALHGEILDIAVDLRKESPTYLQYHAITLSEENKTQFLIPEGFAHGFVTISDTAVISYKCTDFYHKESDGGVAYNDPRINFDWQGLVDEALISDKDKALPMVDAFDNPF
jgi:dTDP-4-dehydrorhamnose 3,5-epimerase